MKVCEDVFFSRGDWIGDIVGVLRDDFRIDFCSAIKYIIKLQRIIKCEKQSLRIRVISEMFRVANLLPLQCRMESAIRHGVRFHCIMNVVWLWEKRV